MNTPYLARVIETFIPIEAGRDTTPLEFWQAYLDLLRTRVGPLVRSLVNDGLVNWYGFLVHSRQSGVPTSEEDQGFYLHLRMALTSSTDQASVLSRLPSVCVMTKQMNVPDPPSLDTIDVRSLLNGNVEQGWKILGESSEWVLNLLDSHEPGKRIPVQNVAQFLHYLGNQLMVKVVEIPMP